MKFGPVPLAEAEGAIAAHSLRLQSGVIRKGTRLTADHLARLAADGVKEVVAARLGPDDVHEDEAARRVAAVLKGANIRLDEAGTGRCNLYAEEAGLLVVDRQAIDALNRLDPGLTVATLPEYRAGRGRTHGGDRQDHPFRASPKRCDAGGEAKRTADAVDRAAGSRCGSVSRRQRFPALSRRSWIRRAAFSRSGSGPRARASSRRSARRTRSRRSRTHCAS